MFMAGGFSRYRALQVSLRGARMRLGPLEAETLNVSYALSRSQATGVGRYVELSTVALDNRRWNGREYMMTAAFDRTHLLTVAASLKAPGGFRLSSTWSFASPWPMILVVPNMGGAIAGTNGFFGTDLNGDGGLGTTPRNDIFPGMAPGNFGRGVKTLTDLNRVIQAFNDKYAGRFTPHGQALVDAGIFTEAQLKALRAVIPAVPLVPPGNPTPFHNLLVTDVRLSRALRFRGWREGVEVVPFLDVYNLFNHAPPGDYGQTTGLMGRFGDLNFDYASAPPGTQVSDLTAAHGRLNPTRKVMIGARFVF